MEECFSHFKRLVQVEGFRAGTRPCALPAEDLGAAEAGTRHVDTRVINLRQSEKLKLQYENQVKANKNDDLM